MKLKKVLILPDIHLTTRAPKPFITVSKFIMESGIRWDEIILLGDFIDNESMSHWIKDKQRLVEGKRYLKEMEFANKVLNVLQLHCKKLTYIEGNHENWTEQYLDNNANMEGLLELSKMLNLEERNIRWIPMNKLYKVGSMYFTHGMYINKYHAANHIQKLGCNICYGHTHNSQSFMQNMKMQEPHKAYGLGCLCGHEPIYMKNRPANWINSFGIMEYNPSKGNFNLHEVIITDNTFIWDGVQYK